MFTIKEIKLQPIPYQEVFLNDTSEVLSIKVSPYGVALYVTMDDTEPTTRVTGLFILPTDDPRVSDIPEDYSFMETLQFISNGELRVLHAFIQLPDFEIGEGDFPDEF